MKKFRCSICRYVYDESKGVPQRGIAHDTRWEDLPNYFICPVCNAPRSMFKPMEEAAS
jgi:rubredoxin